MKSAGEFSGFMNETVVIDTGTPLIYIGKLVGVQDSFLVLEELDVHDINDTPTTKELYILDSKKYGVKKNRRRALLSFDRLVSLSRLDDIIEY